MRDGGTPARRLNDRHFVPLTRMAAERRVDLAGARVERAPGNREIFANQRPGAAMVGEQRGEPLMRGVGLGDDDQPGSVLVEAMDDAWPPDAADSREARAAMADQCVDQRAGGMSRRGMDDEPRGLVDYDEMLVLVDDSQRHILAEQRRILRRWRGNLDSRAGEDLGGGIARPRPVDRDLAGLDQRLEASARKRELALLRRAAQEPVQPLAGVLWPDFESQRPRLDAHAPSRARRRERAAGSAPGGETSGPSAAAICAMSGREPGLCASSARRIAARCVGFVPQQPPTIRAPASTARPA